MNSSLALVLERTDIRRGDAFAVAPAPTLATGFARLDAELPGGGWPRGALTELLTEHGGISGIGELGLLLPALAALTGAGQAVVLIAPPYCAHAPAWAAAGIRLDCLRLVFPSRPRDALWAAVEALRCGGVAATLLWLDALFRAQLPANSLRRLHVAAGEGGGGAFCFRPARLAAAASPAPLRLQLQAQDIGGRLQVKILKRRGPPARQDILLDIARPAGFLQSVPHAVAGAVLPDIRRRNRVAA
ncbi:MAG: translesion DNA synthesis-associated protein ImuA [Sulfuritalea sp.]|jgi:cell division inhibitor SulA/protein ImuA|nr:translesion DNA synthesis-associated protein ImuA [Sulfuritalea sp.]